MIDLHTHILPGVDDGATDLDMALAMARDAAAKGVTAIAATPHFYELPQWPLVKQKVEELCSEFNNARIGVELVAGAELMMDLGIMEMDAGEIPTYGDQGKFCLIEFPMRQIPMYARKSSLTCRPRELSRSLPIPNATAQLWKIPTWP